MLTGLLCALGCAVCFGTSTVLQAIATRAAAAEGGDGLDGKLLLRAVRQWRYVLGMAVDTLGFLLQVIALRLIPIYTVAAALASALAFTAIGSVYLMRTRPTHLEWTAIVVVCAGLGLLGIASGEQGTETGPSALPWALLGVVVLVMAVAAGAGKLPQTGRALLLGLGAGIGFGTVEVAVRLVDSIVDLKSPAFYAIVLGGIAGFVLLTFAVASGSVTTATAGLVLGETIGPSVVGIVWLGDRTREGLGSLALAGFAIAVAGALALSRFGEVSDESAPATA